MAIKCPVCRNSLTEIQAGDVKVDICDGGCGGVWFDECELKKFDEAHEIDGEKIIGAKRSESARIDYDAVRYCPRCPDEAMCKRYYDIKNQVEVDQCLKCSGIWLDVGELITIRSQYATEADRQNAADQYMEGLLRQTKEGLAQDAKVRLEQWEEEVSFRGTMRSLLRVLF
ncbi:MAG TPA: zf-TFIIB domain-containing protein [Oligoflexia bacterium]|nr:zf-TFIIB domain-containing protein [Oligoflexia bacterium]